MRSAPPARDARLTAVAILGGIEIKVGPGTRVTMSGMIFVGGRDVKVEPGVGPELSVNAVAVLGGVDIKEAAAD